MRLYFVGRGAQLTVLQKVSVGRVRQVELSKMGPGMHRRRMLQTLVEFKDSHPRTVPENTEKGATAEGAWRLNRPGTG